jgi:hypothetical protein
MSKAAMKVKRVHAEMYVLYEHLNVQIYTHIAIALMLPPNPFFLLYLRVFDPKSFFFLNVAEPALLVDREGL